ncbi:MAG: ribosome biogenesis GTPase Der [Ignavibacteria bacterium]|nr:ribosome biogenesis GTPase Der [Ignavibacteria bacterium]
MTRKLVAIVGRPNVGKSTLFNRIIGGRQAIVDDQPGVTRDRHYAETEWGGKSFVLIDTGGYVPDSVEEIDTAVKEQAQIAIEEADVVLFVVDGKSGRIPADEEIAQVLRKSGKKVVLVVNKLDSDRRVPNAAEFYTLGLGDPVPVSALMGLRVGDMLDTATFDIPAVSAVDNDARLKIAIVGRPNVGKSSLVNSLLGTTRNIVSGVPGTTRDPVDSVIKYHGEELVLIDTAGLRRRSRIHESVEFYSTVRTIKSIERADVVVVLIDALVGLHHQDLRVIELAMQRRRATILAVNKWDLIEKDEKTAGQLTRILKEKLRMYDFLPIIFVSALTRQRVPKVLDLIKEVDNNQNERIPTSRLNELLGADLKFFPPRTRSGKELKINYCTQVRVKPPVFSFFCNEPSLVEDNYRRYLENSLRKHFPFIGVPVILVFKKK